jgi:hypothetical protein
MKWIRERDALIAQTLAFVQSVAGRKDAAGLAGAGSSAVVTRGPETEPAFVETTPGEASPVEPTRFIEPQKAIPAERPIVPSELQAEIRERIASFRAHQERFNREREQYFSATLAKLRATLDELPSPRRPK